MATLAIPIATALATELIPKIPVIVQAIENWFGPKTGVTKFKVATDMAMVAATGLATAGKISGNPTVEQVAASVQAVVDAMNKTGQLGSNTNVLTKPANTTGTGAGTGAGIEGKYTITVTKA